LISSSKERKFQMADISGFWGNVSNMSDADKRLLTSRNLLEAAEKYEENQLERLTGVHVRLEFRKPRNILKRLSPAPFELDETSPYIAKFAQEVSAATGFDHSGIIVAATTAAAAVIDDRFMLSVQPETDWRVSARQWSFLCANPSAGKSPILRPTTDPVKRIHIEMQNAWEAANRNVDDASKSPVPALFTSDATVAALSERLKGNPRGIFMLNEEFSSWIGSIDTSDRGESAKNRGDWLQLRDGGMRQIDRVGRGCITVPNWGASVLAACTPDGLRAHMKTAPHDGLIQRFIPCFMQPPNLDAEGDCTAALNRWDQTLRWAFSFTTRAAPQICVQLSSGAKSLFKSETKELRRFCMSTEEFAPSYAGHLGKHPGMLAEIALIFHIFWGDAPSAEISAETMATAIKYMRRIRQHAFAMYSSVLGATPAYDLAKALGRSMVASDECTTRINRDWMSNHCAPFKKADDRVRREAVQILEDADWIEAVPGQTTYGGWPRGFNVNDQIFRLFAREGEEWRARREAVRNAICNPDADEDELLVS
jgi:hypothetical protein